MNSTELQKSHWHNDDDDYVGNAMDGNDGVGNAMDGNDEEKIGRRRIFHISTRLPFDFWGKYDSK